MCDQCKHHHDQECECEGQCGGGECGCEDSGHFHRRYQTKDEQISGLETYLAELKLEVQAVEEHLAELRK